MKTILATLCYVRAQGRTLLLHRVKRADDVHRGKWNGLGGKMEPGETPEEGVIREVKEESGLVLSAPRLRGILTFPQFNQNFHEYTFLFTADRFEGEIGECDEGELRWIADVEVSGLPMWEGDYLFLKWLEQERFFSAKFNYENERLLKHEVIFY